MTRKQQEKPWPLKSVLELEFEKDFARRYRELAEASGLKDFTIRARYFFESPFLWKRKAGKTGPSSTGYAWHGEISFRQLVGLIQFTEDFGTSIQWLLTGQGSLPRRRQGHRPRRELAGAIA